jgi:hypothetical protein
MRICCLLFCLLFAVLPSAFAAGTVLIPGTDTSPEFRVPDDISMPTEPAGAAICWLGEAGFLIGLPADWQNAPDAAAHFGLCLMGIPRGTQFNESPVTLYPRIFDRPPGQSPADLADAAAQMALEALSRAPGGENMSVRVGESFVTPLDLPVEIRYFDQGPHPNEFEAVAYVNYRTAALGLVLSATTKEARDAFLPALLQVAREVYPMQVRDERKPKLQE